MPKAAVGLLLLVAALALPGCGDDDAAGDGEAGRDGPPSEHAPGTTEPAVEDEVIEPVRIGTPDQVIPRPVAVAAGEGHFALTASTAIVAGADDATDAAHLLQGYLAPATGLDLPIVDPDGEELPSTTPTIRFVDDPDDLGELGEEGYRLDITEDGVEVTAADAQGFRWAVQTIRQLLPAEIESQEAVDGTFALPVVTIDDQPRFAWRGVMLDVARHFFAIEDVHHLVDLAARYKLNRLHLHLSDDQGWRLEIEGYPELTRSGAATEVGGGEGGFYTQEEYADLVDYAAERGVTVVPEFDMPGHTNAALHAVPELNCDGQPPEPYTDTQVGFSSLCIDAEETYEFVEQVVTEVAALTPGHYLHLGGDEAHSTDHDDYVRFMERVAPMVEAQGMTMVGWDEVGTVPLGDNVVVQYWGSEDNAAAAADQGMDLVMSPSAHAYLDMRYDATTPGNDWAGLIDTRQAYDWEPTGLVEGVPAERVLGVEAPLWTELLSTRGEMEERLLPRLPGVAEVGWSSEERDWDNYSGRLVHAAPRWDAAGFAWTRDPIVPWE